MPSGAEKWFNFLKNFNKLIDLKVIKEEREKQMDWVNGVVKSVQGNFQGNPIALRLNLQDLLKTNLTLTKSIDESTLLCPEDVATELRDLSKDVRTHYMGSVNSALAELRTASTAIANNIHALLFKLSEAALFHVTTQAISHKVVGSEVGDNEVIVGVATTGPILSGNVPALQAWIQKLGASLRSVLTHFLTGKSFNDKIFADYAAAVEQAELVFKAAHVASLVAEIRLAAAVAPIALDEKDVTTMLADFDAKFTAQYAARVALELCAQFAPALVLDTARLCELQFDNAALWEAAVVTSSETHLAGDLSEPGAESQEIRITQIFPEPAAVAEVNDWEGEQAQGSEEVPPEK